MSIKPSKPSLQKKGPMKKGLAGARRRTVSVSTEDMVKRSYLAPGQTMPLVLEGATGSLEPIAWASHNRQSIEDDLVAHGAILFRNFGLKSEEDFQTFSRTLIPQRANYVEGSSPRISTGEKVYTSTEYPADQFVSMHNELSYAHKWPSKLIFFCHTAPPKGGETPIADSREVLRRLPEELVERFRQKEVRYVRNLHGGRGAGLAWQTVFESDDKDFVESYCREGEIQFAWNDEGGLWTEQHRPAIRRHPITGEEVWFNQVDQWHPSNLEEEVARVLLASHEPEELPIWSTFGEGTAFEDWEMEAVRKAFEDTMVRFPWQQGDALLVDNMLAAHGRMPFEGPRRILVAMGESGLQGKAPEGLGA